MDTNVIAILVAIAVLLAFAGYAAYLTHTFGRAQAIEQMKQLTEVIRFAVNEADQLFEASNAEKYERVEKFAIDWLRERGIDFPADTVRQVIEGAVELVHRARERR